MNERQIEKACKKEALEALKQQDKEQKARQAEQDMLRNKARISSHIDILTQERNALVQDVVALRKTDPESANYVITIGREIDEAIKQAKGILAMANGQALYSKIETLIGESMSLMRSLNTTTIKFTPGKERVKLRKQKQLHDMMQKLAREARMDELSIYTGGITPFDGKGSAFEADVLAAEKRLEIAEFDD